MTRPGDPHGERRLVTALFADLTGYTALCRELDPEEVVATVQPLMAGLRFAVRAEDGIVISTAGDGLFAVFGVPAGHEDDAARAMRTADRMRALVVESNRAQPAVRVPEVHIGVASGEVLVLAGEDPGGWSLTGSAVNLAARLCDLAAAGEVLVDQDSRALAGPGASYSEHRVLTVRGITEPVPAALLATPPSRQATRPRQAFIGRETEGRALDALLEQVLATGAGRIARITGEPGIGKTRLVEEWLSGRPDVTGCYGQCAAAGLHSPLGPLVSAVVTTGEADLTDELLAAGVADASQLARRLSGVATGTGPGVDVPTVLAGVRQLLEARGRRGGVVVVLDDTHEAGQELTEALAELSQWPLRGPVLILAVGRTDPRGSDLVLEGLPEPAASTLLAEALGGELARSPAAEIVARAAGNPLYLVQTAAWLRDAGAVVVAGSGVELVRSEVVDELPGTLRTFIAARLDALPGAERLFVLQASTAAEELDSDTVRVLAPDADPGALDSLLARGLLRTSGPGRWRFGHPLVREVAYASLTRSTRARLHARQLRAFELAGHPSLLAHHAERWVRAVPARDSGQRREAVAESLRRSRTHAEMLYRVSARTAFEALSRVLAYTDEADPRDGTGVLSLASRCLIELGDYPEALRMAGRAVECSRVLGDDPIRIDALLNHGDALCRLWRMAEARQQLDAAIAVTERIGDEPARGRALALLANASAAESLERFLEITEAAYLVLDAAGDAEGAAQSARILAWNLGPSGDPAFTRWLAATEAATARDDVRGQAWLSRIRIAEALWHDRYQDALDEAGRTAQLAEDCGARDMLSDAHIVAMEAATALGRLDVALDAHARAAALAAAGGPRIRAVVAASAALALLRSGRLAECRDALEQTRLLAGELGPSEQHEASRAAAEVALDQGAWPAAEVAAARTLELARQIPGVLVVLHAEVRCARVDLALGRLAPERADALAERCRQAIVPTLAGIADALAEQARVSEAEAGAAPAPAAAAPSAGASLEERAIRADTVALAAAAAGRNPAPAWTSAAEAWSRLGQTVWLGRALARAGRAAAAEATFDAVGATRQARAQLT